MSCAHVSSVLNGRTSGVRHGSHHALCKRCRRRQSSRVMPGCAFARSYVASRRRVPAHGISIRNLGKLLRPKVCDGFSRSTCVGGRASIASCSCFSALARHGLGSAAIVRRCGKFNVLSLAAAKTHLSVRMRSSASSPSCAWELRSQSAAPSPSSKSLCGDGAPSALKWAWTT